MNFLVNKVYASTAITPPIGLTNFSDLIACVIKYFVWYIAPLIVVIMVLWGAFQILTAGGEPENFANGRKTIVYAIIGYVLVIIAAGLVAIVQFSLTGGISAATVCPIF